MRVVIFGLATCLVAGAAMAQTTSPGTQSTAPSHNPAVATGSNTNDQAQPARGSNSFTEGQAKSRIEERGYTNVSGLRKDDDGVWRAIAQRSGNSVQVWMDFKGNIGQGQ